MTILEDSRTETTTWAASWLDSHGKAAAVVSPTLEVLWCSSAARRMLEGPGPLVLRASLVAGADRAAHERLIECVARTETHDSVVVLVDGAGGTPTLLLKARRIRDGSDDVALSFAEYRSAVDLPDVGALFSITPAEGDVVRLLAGGKSAVEIADQLDIAVLTVRTHIKRAYSKLGVHSKEQLFAKLSSLTSL